MDEADKRIRRSALKLIVISLALGLLIGLAIGATVAYYNIDRLVVVPLAPRVEA